MPESRWKSVLLPQPDCPMRTVKDFSSSESDTPSTAAKVSPLRWYFFTRFDACKIMLLSPVSDG